MNQLQTEYKSKMKYLTAEKVSEIENLVKKNKEIEYFTSRKISLSEKLLTDKDLEIEAIKLEKGHREVAK